MENLTSIISSELMYALTWTLIHSVWQGLLIVTLLSILIRYADSVSTRYKYIASVLSLFALFAASIFTFYIYFDLPKIAESSHEIFSGKWSEVSTLTIQENESTISLITSFISENSKLIAGGWIVGLVFFMLRILFGLGQIRILKQRFMTYNPLF